MRNMSLLAINANLNIMEEGNLKQKPQEEFDVAVVGGGPAGMMAAGRAAELGARVVLIEKNLNLGKKLLMSGNGRCNISQAEYNDRKFIEKLGKNGQFLFSALSVFGPEEVVRFFKERGLKIKIEKDRRIFPVSDRAQDVLDILIRYLNENRVKLLLGQEVIGFDVKDGMIEKVSLKEKEIIARSFILAVGGMSYPRLGSNPPASAMPKALLAGGKGYEWAEEMGHRIIKPRPALTPIEIKEGWVSDLQGLSLENVRVTIFQNRKKQDSCVGEIMFTHFGLSGPLILNLSKEIGKLLETGGVILKIDLRPLLDIPALDKIFQKDFRENRTLGNYLSKSFPKKLSEAIILFSGISPERKLNTILKDGRKKLVGLLKGLRLTVNGLIGFEQAKVTSGGVELKEIDSNTMRSKIIKNLFFAGEIIDLDGPTGGYNLQICWSTGFSAGNSINSIY